MNPTLHVRLSHRLKFGCTVSETRGVTMEAARAQIQTSDRARRSYLRRFYHVNWDDPAIYDLVLNTGRISAATAADSICHAARLTPEKGGSLSYGQVKNP